MDENVTELAKWCRDIEERLQKLENRIKRKLSICVAGKDDLVHCPYCRKKWNLQRNLKFGEQFKKQCIRCSRTFLIVKPKEARK